MQRNRTKKRWRKGEGKEKEKARGAPKKRTQKMKGKGDAAVTSGLVKTETHTPGDITEPRRERLYYIARNKLLK